MEVAGAIGWQPDVFWRTTPIELWAFFRGWRRANCTPDKEERLPDTPERKKQLEEAPTRASSIRKLRKTKRGLPPELEAELRGDIINA